MSVIITFEGDFLDCFRYKVATHSIGGMFKTNCVMLLHLFKVITVNTQIEKVCSVNVVN
jgi:hypothetical protein